jgi:hypothetical protein
VQSARSVDEIEHAVDTAIAQTRGELRSIREHHSAHYRRDPRLAARTSMRERLADRVGKGGTDDCNRKQQQRRCA